MARVYIKSFQPSGVLVLSLTKFKRRCLLTLISGDFFGKKDILRTCQAHPGLKRRGFAGWAWIAIYWHNPGARRDKRKEEGRTKTLVIISETIA